MSSVAHSGLVAGWSPDVGIFGICDSVDSKRRVEVLLERMTSKLSGNFRLATVLQRYDVFGQTPFPEQFNATAANADIVILALEKNERFQGWLVEWLEKWAANRWVADAALAVFAKEPALASSPTLEILRRLAKRHGLALLVPNDAMADHTRRAKQRRSRQPKAADPFIDGAAGGIQQWDHSGLNE